MLSWLFSSGDGVKNREPWAKGSCHRWYIWSRANFIGTFLSWVYKTVMCINLEWLLSHLQGIKERASTTFPQKQKQLCSFSTLEAPFLVVCVLWDSACLVGWYTQLTFHNYLQYISNVPSGPLLCNSATQCKISKTKDSKQVRAMQRKWGRIIIMAK